MAFTPRHGAPCGRRRAAAGERSAVCRQEEALRWRPEGRGSGPGGGPAGMAHGGPARGDLLRSLLPPPPHPADDPHQWCTAAAGRLRRRSTRSGLPASGPCHAVAPARRIWPRELRHDRCCHGGGGPELGHARPPRLGRQRRPRGGAALRGGRALRHGHLQAAAAAAIRPPGVGGLGARRRWGRVLRPRPEPAGRGRRPGLAACCRLPSSRPCTGRQGGAPHREPAPGHSAGRLPPLGRAVRRRAAADLAGRPRGAARLPARPRLLPRHQRSSPLVVRLGDPGLLRGHGAARQRPGRAAGRRAAHGGHGPQRAGAAAGLRRRGPVLPGAGRASPGSQGEQGRDRARRAGSGDRRAAEEASAEQLHGGDEARAGGGEAEEGTEAPTGRTAVAHEEAVDCSGKAGHAEHVGAGSKDSAVLQCRVGADRH
mmetsp:Transcript_24787/g.78008  ORF Transcript_24787/g.78008 Transcript_24787/m.78008 type:complete len:427 (-) Transcript_24787:245-1525(-)